MLQLKRNTDRRRWRLELGLLVLFWVVMSRGYTQTLVQPTGELRVFAAASLTEPFTEIGRRLEHMHQGLKIVYNFGGSPMLRMQMEQGAHADVFVSADLAQMDLARSQGVVQGEAPIFARNRLVVIVPHDNPRQIQTFQDLANPGLKLTLAAARVPVGQYSRQALSMAQAAYGVDFAQRVLRNLVSEEENVKQVVTKVQLGEADAGLVYVSDVTPKVRQDILALQIPDAYNPLATYPMALTTGVKNRPAAEAFVAFVLSPPGQAILSAHNFLPVRD